MEERTETLKVKAARGFFWAGMNNFAIQLLNMIFGLVLARLLLPEDYGIVGMLNVFVGLASAIQEGGLSSALINKKDATHADYQSVFGFNLIVSICIYLILFCSTPLIAAFYDVPELIWLGRVLFCGFFFSAVGTVPYVILVKGMRIKEVAISSLTAVFVSGAAGIIMAICGLAYWGLAIQSVSMFLIRSLLFCYFSRWRIHGKLELRRVKPMLSFGLKILLNRFVDVLNSNILTIILGKFYSKHEVGYYNQAQKWNYMAYSVLAGMVNSMSQTVLVQASDEKDRQRRAFRKMLQFTSFLSFPCMLGLALVAPEFIVIALTSKWIESALLLQILCIGGSVSPLLWMYSNLALSKGKSGVALCYSITMSLFQLSAVIFCRPYGIHVMVVVYVLICFIWMILWQIYAKCSLQIRLLDLVKDIFPFMAATLVGVAIGSWFSSYIHGILFRLLVKLVCSFGIYVLVMHLFGVTVYRESLQFIKNGLKKVCKRQ